MFWGRISWSWWGGGGGERGRGGGLTRKDNAFLGLINSFLVTIEPMHAMAAWQELLSFSLGCSTSATFSLIFFFPHLKIQS